MKMEQTKITIIIEQNNAFITIPYNQNNNRRQRKLNDQLIKNMQNLCSGLLGRDTEQLRKSSRNLIKCLLNAWTLRVDFMASGNRFQCFGPWKQIAPWRNEVRQNGGQILILVWCCVNAFWRSLRRFGVSSSQHRNQVIQNFIHIG